MTVRVTSHATDAWCILRCPGASTLRLAQSLIDAEFEAWTPAEEIRKPVRGNYEWVVTPMLPTFVFASASRIADLMALARNPSQTCMVWDRGQRRFVTKGHPFFRLFHIGDNYPLVPAHELEPLRRIEGRRKRKPRGKPREYHPGDRVRLTEGAYEGLRGTVLEIKGRQVKILVPGSNFSFDVPAYLPVPDLDDGPGVKVIDARSEQEFRTAA